MGDEFKKKNTKLFSVERRGIRGDMEEMYRMMIRRKGKSGAPIFPLSIKGRAREHSMKLIENNYFLQNE